MTGLEPNHTHDTAPKPAFAHDILLNGKETFLVLLTGEKSGLEKAC